MKQPIVYPIERIQEPEFSDVQAFFWNYSGPLRSIQASIEWEIQNICIYHAYVSSGLSRESAKLESKINEQESYYKNALKEISDEDDQYPIELLRSRFLDRAIDIQNVINASDQFLDETTIVSLWMISERFLGQIYREFYTHIKGQPPANIPYKFDTIKTNFANLSVDLTASHLYADADECRTLNNAIKHGNTVSTSLKKFPFFQNLSGPLRKIDLQMQRYVNGVHNFLGSTIEQCHTVLGVSP